MVSNIECFFNWLYLHHFQNTHALEVQNIPGMGYGIVSPKVAKNRQMDSREYSITIPSKLLISASKIQSSDPETYGKIVNEDQVVILFLILERKKGRSSQWYPYLNILTENYVPPYEWKEEPDYVKLLPKSYQKFMINENRKYMRHYREICAFFTNHGLDGLTFSLFRWAYTNFFMRTMFLDVPPAYLSKFPATPERESYLIPFADFFNHRFEGDGETRLTDDGCCQFDINGPAYGQIFVNYNQDMSNGEFYVTYGFCNITPRSLSFSSEKLSIIASPNDRIAISKTLLLDWLSQYTVLKQKLEILRSTNLFLDSSFDYRWPEELYDKRLTFENDSSGESKLKTIISQNDSSKLSIPAKRVEFLSPILDAFLQVLCRKFRTSQMPSTVKDLYSSAMNRLDTHTRCDLFHSFGKEEAELYQFLIDTIFVNARRLSRDFVELIDPIDLETVDQSLSDIPPGDLRNIIANHYGLFLYIDNRSFQFKHKTYPFDSFL